MPDTNIHNRLLGRIGIKLKYLSEAQLEECLKEQRASSTEGSGASLLGRIMLSKGIITETQLETMLNVQKKLKLEREQCALAQMGIGEALARLGDTDEAIRQYTVVMEKYPDVFEVCAATKNKIAEVYQKTGQPKKAMDTLRRLLEDHEK